MIAIKTYYLVPCNDQHFWKLHGSSEQTIPSQIIYFLQNDHELLLVWNLQFFGFFFIESSIILPRTSSFDLSIYLSKVLKTDNLYWNNRFFVEGKLITPKRANLKRADYRFSANEVKEYVTIGHIPIKVSFGLWHRLW